jgi:hypothetical protein
MGCEEHEKYDGYEKCDKKGECSRFFPDDIEELLRKLVCEHVVLTYKNGGKERVKIECVSGCLLVVKDDCNFRFINIDCICSVAVSCDTILNAILGSPCK